MKEKKGKTETRLGSTGKYPEGKMKHDDDGEIAIAVSVVRNNVYIEFGAAVKWLAMPPDKARELAGVLIANANSIVGRIQ